MFVYECSASCKFYLYSTAVIVKRSFITSANVERVGLQPKFGRNGWDCRVGRVCCFGRCARECNVKRVPSGKWPRRSTSAPDDGSQRAIVPPPLNLTMRSISPPDDGSQRAIVPPPLNLTNLRRS
uniref:Uncharacterized protein n=1 Tax=Ascaris lumbricoides TaxID=6252 RepID=A0A0M3HF02_ASCLU